MPQRKPRRRRDDRAQNSIDTSNISEVAGLGLIERLWTARRSALIGVVLFAGTFLVYGQTGGFEFVNFDDSMHVTKNEFVRTGISWRNTKWAFQLDGPSQWHPLTWLSHQLDCQLFGQDAGSHHLVSVFLHATSAVVLFLALSALTGAVWTSALAAALFAVHPLNVESVAWIAQRKTVLSGLFGMLTLWAYAHYVRQGRGARYAAVLGLFALSLASKPMLVALPAALLLLDFWPLRRVKHSSIEWEPQSTVASDAGQSSHQSAVNVRPVRFLVAEKLPLFALSLIAAGMTLVGEPSPQAGTANDPGSFTARLANAVTGYFVYVKKAVWPAPLSVCSDFTPPVYSIGAAIVAGLVLLSLTGVAFAVRKRDPAFPVGWLWFLGLLFPVIGILPVRTQVLAERYAYFPIVGLAIAMAWGTRVLGQRFPQRLPGISGGAFVAVLLLAVLSINQSLHWKNSLTLFAHAVSVAPDDHLAHNNLGQALHEAGRLDEAAAEFRRALEIVPNDASGHFNLGVVLKESGRLVDAEQHLSRSVQLDPRDAEGLCELGAVLQMRQRPAESLPFLEQAVELAPGVSRIRNNYGSALAVLGRMEDAAEQFREAVRLDMTNAQAHYNLALALRDLGQTGEAVVHFQKAQSLGISKFTVDRDRPNKTEGRLR